MKREMILPNGDRFVLRVARDVLKRLDTTCFGTLGGKAFAGKFARWPTLDAMLKDKAFTGIFLPQAAAIFEALEDDDSTVDRMTMEMPEPIGWDTTAPREGIGSDELESYFLNSQTGGLVVKANLPRKAPLTRLITLSFRASKDWRSKAIEIFSINPGFDIGWISSSNSDGADITAEQGRVFFSFEHPGEDLAAA